MANNLCFVWSSPCFTLTEWKEISLIFAAYVGTIGAVIAAFKTLYEIKKLRGERQQERRSRIHQKQLDALIGLYVALNKVLGHAQRTISLGRVRGQNFDNDLVQWQSSINDANQQFISSRLLLPEDITQMVESFFQKVFELHLNIEMFVETSGEQRASCWDNAAKDAHREMPTLLSSIEAAARSFVSIDETTTNKDQRTK